MRSAVVVLLLALAACKLAEIVVAPGARTVVVQSVIARERPEQFVLVQGSYSGQDSSSAAISGALVTIEHLTSISGQCAGHIDTLGSGPDRPADSTDLSFPAGALAGYSGSVCDPNPGDRLRLRVRTPAGEEVTGTTIVPGAVDWQLRVGGRVIHEPADFSPGDTIELNADSDTLRIAVEPVRGTGRALQVELRRARFHDQLAFVAVTDSLGIAIPGNLVDPFEGDSGAPVFLPGRTYVLTVALTDSNYYDFIRSRSDPLTGRGFINRLTGGIGVFGSIDQWSFLVRVANRTPTPSP